MTEPAPQRSMLEHALDYAANGLPVIPLHSIVGGECTCSKGAACDKSPGKHPRTLNGSKDATIDEAAIRRWWKMWPSANIGIATGHDLGGAGGTLAVIDIDPGHGGVESFVALCARLGDLPDGMRVRTGSGGQHIYLRIPDGHDVRNGQGNRDSWQGVDVRGAGGFVVAPPSNHVLGEYSWTQHSSPGAIPPAWLAELTSTSRRSARASNAGGLANDAAPIADGSKHQTLVSMAGTMRRRGMTAAEIDAALQVVNRERCETPAPPENITAIAHDIAGRYEPDPEASAPPAVGEVTSIEEALVVVKTLKAAMAEDPQAALREEFLPALAFVKQHSDLEWARVEGIVKSVKNTSVTWVRKGVQSFVDERNRQLRELRAKPEEVDGSPIVYARMPDKWRLRSEGVFYCAGGGDADERVLPVPLWLTRRLKSIDTNEEKVELAWRADGGVNKTICNRSVASTAQGITSLADQGLPVNSGNAAQVVKYLAAIAAVNDEVIPLERCTERCGWVGAGRFYPHACEDVTFAPADTSMVHAFGTHGTLEEWVEGVSPAMAAWPLLRVQLAASFAAPLLKITGHRNFIVHLWGDSGGGKTATMRTALSVWGSRSQMATFNGTVHGLQNRAYLHCDVPFGVNERQVGPKNVDQFLYALCEGIGRVQGARGGGNRATLAWRSIILTNGEEPLTRSTGMQGTRTRTIELEGVPVGDEALASSLHDLSDKCYGVAGERYMQMLLGRADEQVNADYSRMLKAIEDDPASRSNDRVRTHITSVALLALADWYMQVSVIGDDPVAAWYESQSMGAWLAGECESRTENDQKARVAEVVANLYRRNRYRFALEANGTTTANDYWGFVEPSARRVWFLTSVLEAELDAMGLSYRSALRSLHLSEAISVQTGSGKTRFGIRRQGGTYNSILLPDDAFSGDRSAQSAPGVHASVQGGSTV